ncbi:hypothetical protein DM558_15120 [Entomomonas moraniae]|uniref:Cupin n=1 Tax=Entomomonas moraniae TaxID=2213226 RepID=A0A3Q9JNF1_9GAMM|nr:cupin domain-containing protein [Entomomonas moraniae]AZS52020.1 hypothetical protein DM558_15120 [Entomomonas moraniae]
MNRLTLCFIRNIIIGLLISTFTLPILAKTIETPGGPPQTTTEVILKTTKSWDNVPYKNYPIGNPELIVMTYHIPAHSALPWHKHFVPNAAYVASGILTVEEKDGSKKVFTKGQVVPEMVGPIHRGVTGNEPVELVVFYASSDQSKITEKVDN